MQGNIIILDAGSQPGASPIATANDCCNACRQNDQVSIRNTDFCRALHALYVLQVLSPWTV